MPAKLLRLYGRNLLHHLGALIGALVPIVVQLTSHSLGWVQAEALSTGVVVTWLLANAHVTGKLAASIATDLQSLVSGGAGAGGLSGDLNSLIGEAMALLGGAGPKTAKAPGPLAGMAPPPGMEGLFPSGQPTAEANVTVLPATPPTVPPTAAPTVPPVTQ